MGSTHKVVHMSGTKNPDAGVVTILDMVDRRTVVRNIGAIIDIVLGVNEANSFYPVPSLVSPGGVRIISSIPGQSGTEVEKAPIGDGIFVVISDVKLINLPSQTTLTICSIPTRSLGYEHCLCKSKPLWFVLWRVREVVFRGRHRSHSPEALQDVSKCLHVRVYASITLIIISECLCLVGRHVIFIIADLEEQSL